MNFSKNDLVFIPLGGSGEIGMNCNLYHYNNSWIMIDLGVMFGNSNLSSNELIMPNIEFLINDSIHLSISERLQSQYTNTVGLDTSIITTSLSFTNS